MAWGKADEKAQSPGSKILAEPEGGDEPSAEGDDEKPATDGESGLRRNRAEKLD